MKKTILVILVAGFFSASYAQTESVHLHFDKTICYPADTAWFTAYIFDNNTLSNFSKNLYVELYDESNHLSLRKVFLIANGMSMGQLELPKKVGMYWIRSYTRNSSYFLQSLTIRGVDNAVVVRNLLDYKESPVTTEASGLLINSQYNKKGISCTIFPENSSPYNNQPFKLILKYYNTKIGDYAFIINQGRQRNILISPDSLRGYVHGYVSLLFYNSDTLVAKQDLFIPQREVPAQLIKEGDGYIFRINDSTNWTYSLSVVNTSAFSPSGNIEHSLSVPATSRVIDTSYLTFHATVSSTKGKEGLIKDADLVVALGKDSLSNIRLLPIDHLGKISYSGLRFFGTSNLNYLLNGYTGDKVSDIKITLTPEEYPEFTAPDSTDYESDTLNIIASLNLPNLDTLKYLKPVYVEASYKKALDNRYTTGRFSWPAHFSYDLIHADKYNYSILDYLQLELPWFGYNPFGNVSPGFKFKPVIFYLDEQVINWRELFNIHIKELAYVKVIEDFIDDDPYIRSVAGIDGDKLPTLANPYGTDNSPSAMICLYTPKGKDLRFMPGKLLTVPIKGYDQPQSWSYADRATLLWAPYNKAHEYRFALPSTNSSSFKLIVEGANKNGEVLHFERELSQDFLSINQK